MNIEKILIGAAIVFISLDLYIAAVTPPAVGFELSIYDAYPVFFWFFMIGAIACGITILLRQTFAQQISKLWWVGFAIVISANTLFLLLPEFRGYAICGRGDTLTHLGQTKDVLATGHLGGSDFYPVTHILAASLIEVAGLPLEKIPSLYFVLFYVMYVSGMYLLARATTKNLRQVVLIAAFATPMVYSYFHVNIHPSMLSLFMVPLLLSFFQRREQVSQSQRSNLVALIIVGFTMTFFHPVTALFVIFVLIVFGLATTLYSYLVGRKMSRLGQYRTVGRNYIEISLIMSMLFFTWYLSYSYIQRSFKRVYEWLAYQIGTSVAQHTLEPLVQAGLTPLQTIELFMNRYGAIFLWLLISSICCIVIGKSLLRRQNLHREPFNYAIQFVGSLFIAGVMLFGYFVEYEPERVVRLPLLMGTMVSGLVVYELVNKGAVERHSSRRYSIVKVGLLIFLMCVVALGMGSVYGSPRTLAGSSQVTRMEIAGTSWFERLKDPNIWAATNLPESLPRFADYNFGVDTFTLARGAFPQRLPSHFGYDENRTIAETFGFTDRYIIIFEVDKIAHTAFPENVRPKVHQYNMQDFAKLSSDPSAARIYCNGEFEVWIAHA